jgi:hypothetical protein
LNSPMDQQNIINKYMEYLGLAGARPVTVAAFCKKIRIPEKTFYEHFTGLEQLENRILSGFAARAWDSLKASADFQEFTINDQVLTYFYAFAEILTENQGFIRVWASLQPDPMQALRSMTRFRKDFLHIADQMIQPAIRQQQIADRKFLNKLYNEALWLNLLLVMGFWFKDESLQREDTDALIEKSVQLTMDLFGKGTFDKAVDLGRFLIGKAL